MKGVKKLKVWHPMIPKPLHMPMYWAKRLQLAKKSSCGVPKCGMVKTSTCHTLCGGGYIHFLGFWESVCVCVCVCGLPNVLEIALPKRLVMLGFPSIPQGLGCLGSWVQKITQKTNLGSSLLLGYKCFVFQFCNVVVASLLPSQISP